MHCTPPAQLRTARRCATDCFTDLKKLTLLLSLLGFAALTVITAWLGFGHVLHAMQRIGTGGFAELIVGQAGMDCVLGLAWWTCCRKLGLFRAIAARAVRDAAGNCLPFSQLGGMVLGIRATCFDGRQRADGSCHPAIAWPEAVAANLVDITSEVIGQIIFILLALLCLIGHSGGEKFVWPLLGGIALLSIGIAGFIYTQHRSGAAVRRVAGFFGRHIADGWRDTLVDNMDAFQAELDALWGHPGRIAAGAAMHVIGWLCSAALTLLALHLLGAPVSLTGAVAIEGVVCGIMSAGFLVPASLGVQEAAYVALGVLFGVAPDVALGLSLLRRGRDLALGIPILLVWQASEVRRLRRATAATDITEQDFQSPPSRRRAS